MSTSIDSSFAKEFDDEYKLVYQRKQLLRDSVRVKTGIRGEDLSFEKLGKGKFSGKARHGVPTPLNLDHTSHVATITDEYGQELIDRLDTLKQKVEERTAVQESIAWAGGRAVDDQIITQLATATTTVAMVLTSEAAFRNSVLTSQRTLMEKDVPWDGNVYAAVSPNYWSFLMTVEEFTSADWRGPANLPYAVQQGAKTWLGINWIMHSGLPKSTNTRTNFMYHKWSTGYAEQESPSVDIWWDGRAQMWVLTGKVAHGAVLIDDDGVVKMTIDESVALPTT